ncbi:MAG: hypothetical protein ABSD92_13925 [Candidatus Bathyarchaeia archaeon]|jgi:hypothetical protein
MNEFNIEQHEKALKEMNQRILNGERVDVQNEIAMLLGETNLAYKLQERLTQQINQQISPKARERLSTRQYLMRREAIEEDVIRSGFPYAFFNEECIVEEIRDIRLDVLDKKTLMWLVIEALKGFVDSELADNPKAVLLHGLYLQLRNELKAILPFQSDCEDGFIEYLASKDERTELEGARESGSICIVCGSHAVSSKGAEWVCRDCGKRFRKH